VSPIPGCDRHLDADVVRVLLREQFPHLADEPIAYLAEGYDHQMYEVGEWLFRFPKRAEVVPWFVREVAALPVIEPVIGVPVPHFDHIGERSDAFPYPFAGYRRLPGISAADVECVDIPHLARALGDALARLHAIDPALIPLASEPDEPPTWGFRWDDAVLTVLPIEVRDEAAAFLRNEVERPPFEGAACIVHSDLLPEHVLIDESGRLSGLIDFADLCVGDPTGDFVGLLDIGGRELVDETLANYDAELDGHFRDRLEWRLRAYYLHELIKAFSDGDDVGDRVDLVRFAFES
jgi:aminoglycoside phosphotransferase (APT) family kinase protein